MNDLDVTKQVEFDLTKIDSELLPLSKCVCGKEFDSWDYVLSIYPPGTPCPNCGRRLYMQVGVHVYESKNE